MKRSSKKDATRNQETDNQRRAFLKLAAAGGATVMASPWTFQSSRSAPRPVKIGMVSPQTGPIAAFGEADQFVLAGVRKAIGDGILIVGEKHPVQIIYKDSQSNPNRAAEVTTQLINNDKVDIVIGSSTSDTVIPVSDQCELAGVPCVTSDDPWQIWFFGRKGDPKKGFEWTYHFFWGIDQLGDIFADMWLAMPSSNRVLGTLWSNDGDGVNANAHLPDFFRSKGFDVHNLGLYNNNADDFSAQIAELKRSNCEIVSGVFTPPEFGIFWTQCAQQGYRPKMVTPAKALLFPTAVEALGDRGAGLSTEVWWSHHHPFKSGLTGETALQFCNAYTAATGKQWTQPIGFKHANLEVAIDVLKRARALDPNSIRDAIIDTDYQSLVGPVAWKGGPHNPVKNACSTPLVGGQWKKGEKFKYDLHVVYNQPAPNIPLDSPFEPIHYS
jgi:branched-chain amino acid transport system substrate-binding protein